MYFATKSRLAQILVWLIWAVACLVFLIVPEQAFSFDVSHAGQQLLATVMAEEGRQGTVFPWQPKRRLRKWAWRRYCAWRRARRRAMWVARLTWLAWTGALSLAQLVDWVTHSQIRLKLGVSLVLYATLKTLRVREIINRHCPTAAEVDHGTVALVLIINRLMMPQPLYKVADWLTRTVLVYKLGLSAKKFNDDRLARTLDAISQHTRDIWQDVVHRALVQADIDLSLIFYDLTAFVVHGNYAHSQHADFGFAHNTPMGKRKFKVGLDVSADGDIPLEHKLWSGRTADQATVQENMARLYRLLKQHGWAMDEVMIIGDRANLNDELALAYEDRKLRYLAGLRPNKKVHRELLTAIPTHQFYAYPLTDQKGPGGYWGVPRPVVFKHAGRQTIHRGVVVLSGPMRTAQRKTRAAQFKALRQELCDVQAKIGRPYYRTVDAVQKRANTRLKNSPVGKLMRVTAYHDEQDQIRLRWWVDRYALWQTMERDGRYLLVTNDCSLSSRQMLALYRQKDGVERRFKVSKSQLKVSPIYLHKDERIEAMLLINMLALLVYSLLERQARRGGLQMTTRRIIEKLESLEVIETLCWDGSRLLKLAPVDQEQVAILETLAHILAELRLPRWPHTLLSAADIPSSALPPPATWQDAA
jgi:transposase